METVRTSADHLDELDDAAKAALAISLMRRVEKQVSKLAGLIETSQQPDDAKYRRAMQALEGLTDVVDDGEAPDAEWWRDYFLLTGDHCVLYEEGWEPGEQAAIYEKNDPDWEPFDEVNAP